MSKISQDLILQASHDLKDVLLADDGNWAHWSAVRVYKDD
jgi:hypothetical protein